METTWRALNKGNNRKRYQARSLYSLALAHPFFLASSGEAAFGFFFVTERMRLFSAPHPQLSVITLSQVHQTCEMFRLRTNPFPNGKCQHRNHQWRLVIKRSRTSRLGRTSKIQQPPRL